MSHLCYKCRLEWTHPLCDNTSPNLTCPECADSDYERLDVAAIVGGGFWEYVEDELTKFVRETRKAANV